ncbi:MAG: hypothetical protein PVI75_03640 [Gammaproteobacteria bacterium]
MLGKRKRREEKEKNVNVTNNEHPNKKRKLYGRNTISIIAHTLLYNAWKIVRLLQKLTEYIMSDDVASIKKLLRNNANLARMKNSMGYTPIQIAAQHHKIKSFWLLFKYNCSITDRDPGKNSPLNYFIKYIKNSKSPYKEIKKTIEAMNNLYKLVIVYDQTIKNIDELLFCILRKFPNCFYQESNYLLIYNLAYETNERLKKLGSNSKALAFIKMIQAPQTSDEDNEEEGEEEENDNINQETNMQNLMRRLYGNKNENEERKIGYKKS